MKQPSKRTGQLLTVAAGSLLTFTLGSTTIYADTPSTNQVKPTGEVSDAEKIKDSSEITEEDINAKTEQYDVVTSKGAIQALTGYDVNETSFLKKNGIVISGVANAGITYNGNEPTNGFNGPVTFGDRASEFQLNQLNLNIQKAVATEGNEWSFGGRLDTMFGTDSIFTQAYGVPAYNVNTGAPMTRSNWDLNILSTDGNRFYGIALPQAYAEAYVPIGNGLDVKVGHFYTPIGYETVPANENFFYSHAYTMQYGEPFTHTGALSNYNLTSNWSLMGGITTGSATGGWDGGFDKQLGTYNGIAGATWTSNDKGTSANVSGTYGNASDTSNKTWALYSIVLKHNSTEKTHFVLQHDHGFADGVTTYGINTYGTNPVNAEWYGINSHLYYDIKDNLSVGMRAEWFRDQNGFRVWGPGRVAAATNNSNNSYAVPGVNNSSAVGASYYELTWGLNWKPTKWLNLRPNVRYDWIDTTATTYNNSPFGGQQDQVLFSNDFTVTF